MSATLTRTLASDLLSVAHPLTGSNEDFEPVLEQADRKRFVLIGEASHGTHEFYRMRAELTKRLIREQGFRAVAIEGDWPDAHRVNRYVRSQGGAPDAERALSGFTRFPMWMWRNADVLDFVGWLRAFNDSAPPERAVGFYGLDLYSMHASIEAVVTYLRRVDPAAAVLAARRYGCFDRYGAEPQHYGYATAVEHLPSCENAVVEQLLNIRARTADYLRQDGRVAADDLFFAEQNAKVVVEAERYYRAMYRGSIDSWNVRDRHMVGTLEALRRHLESQHEQAKIVVWAHNSHLGDARATEMGRFGEVNVGQLVRQEYGDDALLVGFTTYEGTVAAASDWGAPVERKRVRPALADSYEALLHQVGFQKFYLDLHRNADLHEALTEPRLERAIGVIYHPETERMSHYFTASLPRQFDGVFHYDRTRAVEPLERTGRWAAGANDLPDTYPTAL
ncbi:MAG: erythromycin esterase family protein [Gemmatimonadaceae bacterium]